MTITLHHYESLLSEYYTWSRGSFDSAVEQQLELLQKLDLSPVSSQVAVDLGAGTGFQSAALATSGYSVIAIDFSQAMLSELKQHCAQLDVRAVCDDIKNASTHCQGGAELVVCMGDTLTHLESDEQTRELFDDVTACLKSGGHFLLEFRDLTNKVTGLDRFFLLQSDDDTTFTCFLEDAGDRCKVHDLIQVREGGKWLLRKSSYYKLRIDPDRVKSELEGRGFETLGDVRKHGLVRLLFRYD